MKDESQPDPDYGNEEEDDMDAWDEALYGNEEDDELVAQAMIEDKKNKQLEEQISEIRIQFKPENYEHGKVAQIVGDFTEWVPENMTLPPISIVELEPSQQGLFYYVCKVVKGFRYRYLILWNEKFVVDKAAKYNKNSKERETNYIEVADSHIPLMDFLSEHNPDLTKEEAEEARNSNEPQLRQLQSNFN